MGKEPEIVITVPGLTEGSRVVVSQVELSRNIRYAKHIRSPPYSAADYLGAMNLPTLAELRHAFFDRNSDGSYVSPEYRQSVLSEQGRGEWTSTFFADGRRIIERPACVFRKNGIWLAEGGKVAPIELPPEGYVIEYDKPSGVPSRTSYERKDAEKVFGDDTSYFHKTTSGIRAVLRRFSSLLSEFGPFYIEAIYEPGEADGTVGGRDCNLP